MKTLTSLRPTAAIAFPGAGSLTRRTSRIAAWKPRGHWVGTIAVLLFATAANPPALSSEASQAPYAAHEWGTFTSVQGSNGKPIAWNPFVTADLPHFVFNRTRPSGNDGVLQAGAFQVLGIKNSNLWLQRMETPVIYFHSDEELSVDVNVGFPDGLLTEWFPQVSSFGPVWGAPSLLADSAESHLQWNRVKVLSAEASRDSSKSGCIPTEAASSHYYPARQTAANLVESTVPFATEPRLQRDRFLFYRGAGNFKAPLRAGAPVNGTVELVNEGTEPLGPLFLLHVQDGRALFQPIDSLAPGARVERSTLIPGQPETRADVVFTTAGEQLRAALVTAGLDADEASAMVATWREDWFQDQGLRVLYLLPRAWTDRVLPLSLKPAPSELVRVMVGRADILEPSVEKAVASLVTTHARGDTATAVAGLNRLNLGRLLEPALTRAGRMILSARVEDPTSDEDSLPRIELTPEGIQAWNLQIDTLKASLRIATATAPVKLTSTPAVGSGL